VIASWASRYLEPEAVSPEAVSPEGVSPEGVSGALDRAPDEILVQETRAGKLQVEVIAGNTRFLADEPVEVGGLASGPGPYDLLCAALGACTAMTLRLYADQKQWPLERVRVAVRHSKDKDHKPADRFFRRIALEGPLDSEQRARLLEIAGRCPVHRTLEAGSAIETVAAESPHGE
jgi:putative redox protein